tara:strand:- start:1373 stop:1618 length:246 start_codon:yes stop_codon:yes gene_type:complete
MNLTEEINAGTKIISHFIDNCTEDFNSDDWLELKERHNLFSDQFLFWVQQNNFKRLMIDVRDFTSWFCDKIAEVSERENNG